MPDFQHINAIKLELGKTRDIFVFMADSEPGPIIEEERAPKRVKPLGAVRSGATTLLRQFLALLGVFFIIIGIPIAIMTPFPFVPIGLPIVIFGVVLLGRFSVWGHNWMEGMLVRHPSIEKFAPNWVMKLVFGREKQADLQKDKGDS